jgi:heat shock protein HslJ
LTVDDRRFDEALAKGIVGLASEVVWPVDAQHVAREAIRPRRSAVAVLLTVAAAVLLMVGFRVGVLDRFGPASTMGPVGASSGTATTSTALIPQPVEMLRLDWESYDLAYDPGTNSLWLAVMHPNEADFLYRIDAASGTSERWQLPDTLHNGFLTEVDVAADGAIWLTMEYRLVRFDPVTASQAILEFPVVEPAANRYGGTWLSAIGVDGDSVWVTRNGLSTLVRVGPSMEQLGRLELGDAYLSSEDVAAAGDRIFVLTPGSADSEGSRGSQRGVGILSREGQEVAFALIQASRLAVVDGRVFAGGGGQMSGLATAWIDPDGTVEPAGADAHYRFATATSADSVVTYRSAGAEAAVIERHEDGSTHVLAAFPQQEVEVCRAPITRPNLPSASTSCPRTLVGAPVITALTVDASGAVWYVENIGQGAILWKIGMSMSGASDPARPSQSPDSTPTQPSSIGPPTDPSEIVGEWRLTAGLVDGQPITLVESALISLEFDGTAIGGKSSCNWYGLIDLKIEPGRMSISGIEQTMRGCSGDVGTSEREYFAALRMIDAFTLRDGGLILSGPEVELTFERA